MNLYHIQDSDAPKFVLADSWTAALEKWRTLIRSENDMTEDEPCEPTGIHLMAEAGELIL